MRKHHFPLSLRPESRDLRVQIWSAHESDVVGFQEPKGQGDRTLKSLGFAPTVTLIKA